MPDGWATAMMELVLRVDKNQVQRDIEQVDTAPAGRKAGAAFGTSFSKEQLTRMNAGMTQFAAGANRTSDQAGQQSGRTFGQSFSQLASGIVTSFFRGANQAKMTRASEDAGSSSGEGFGERFTRDVNGKLRDFQGRFVQESGTSGSKAGTEAGRSWGQSFVQLASGIVSSFIAGATASRGGAAGGGTGFLGRAGAQGGSRNAAGALAAGIGPNILGLQVLGKAGLIGGAGMLGVGALPALVGAAAPLGLAAVGGGAAASLFGQVAKPATGLVAAQQKIQAAQAAAVTPAQHKAVQAQQQALNQQLAQLSPAQKSLFDTITKLQDMWQKFTKSFAPLFAQAIAPLPRLFAQILPALQQFFRGALTMAQPLITGLGAIAKTALPLLGQAFRAAAPLLAPLLTGLAQLLGGILPGLITLLKAAAPAAIVFANFLGGLGRGLGTMFAQFAPVIQSSSVLLGDLLGLVNALLPIIGQLAGIFARTLAPAFTAFAGIVQSLLPGLTVIGRLVAQLAAAMLTDLAAAFQAVAGLFAAIGPALTAFAKAISGIFTVLENTGVWAILGNAIESIVGPLGQLISAVLRGLTPILPPVIGFVGQLAAILAGQLGRAIAAILPPLTLIATQALALLARFLPPLLPLINQLARQLGGALVAAVVALAPSITQLATVALQTLAVILPVVLPLITGFARVITGISARAITDLAIALNAIITAIPPRVLSSIVVGILAIAAGLKLWAAIQAILDIELSANPIGLVIAAVAGLAIGITELVRHWNTVWGAITASARAVGAFFTRLFRNQVVQDILAVWSAGLIPLAEHWRQVWAAIRSTAVTAWHGLYRDTLAPLINWCTVSLPHALDTSLAHVRGWWRDVTTAFSSGWNTVWRNTIVPMENLFTRDLPNWFNIAVTNIGRWWNNLTAAIRAPVKTVIDTVLNGIINVFDWITSHIGLGRPIANVHPFGLAGGGRIPGYGGGDRHPALLESGETVVSKDDSRLPYMVAAFKAAGVRGYQSGGKVGQNAPPAVTGRFGPQSAGGISGGIPGGGVLSDIGHGISAVAHKALDIGKITAALATGNSAALTNAFSDLLGHTGGATRLLGQILTQIPKTLIKDAVNWIMGAGGASGNAIADYAMSFLGKIPYVWGGTAVPGGADCSGFVQAIYEHFRIHAPRTSEAQGAWVRRTGPQPGGLAFYHSPPGGSDPGHVAIVRSASQVISQGGGLGPQLMNIHALPLLWTGIPPGGLGSAVGGATGGRMSPAAIAALWTQSGGPAWAALNMARIAFAESGDDASAVQKGQPPGLTGWGLYQITPTSGITQNGAFGNLLNAANNTRAAISLFGQSGYGPWTSDPVAAGLTGAGARRGFARGGWINEPVTGVGRYSRALYSFAERGRRELVTPEDQVTAGPGTGTVVGELRALRQSLDMVPARTAAGVARAVTVPQAQQAHAARVGAR